MASQTFGWFEEKLNEESEKRDAIKPVVKELETALRVLETHLQQVHQTRQTDLAPLVARARELFADIRAALQKLASIVPAASFYRFHTVPLYAQFMEPF
jgi:endonuclease/exonuclease/phosphatase family metal-dependent hydrolase